MPGSILNVFLSLLSNQAETQESYSKLIRKNIIFSILITAVTGTIMFFLSHWIYLFYGQSYLGGEEIFLILVMATIPMALINVLEQICISNSKPGLVIIFQFLIQFLILLTAYILFQYYQTGSSLAYSFLIGYSIAVSLILIYLHQNGMLTKSNNLLSK